MTDRSDGTPARSRNSAGGDAGLTPIFDALTLASASAAADPDERFRRDPLSAPLPAAARRAGPAARMTLGLVRDHPAHLAADRTTGRATDRPAPDAGRTPGRTPDRSPAATGRATGHPGDPARADHPAGRAADRASSAGGRPADRAPAPADRAAGRAPLHAEPPGRHAGPRPAGPRPPASPVDGSGGRHRALRAVAPYGSLHGRPSGDE